MRPWAILPVRALDEGKSRLGQVLAPAARQRLSERFLTHSLAVATGVLGGARTLVISRDGRALAAARALGATALWESDGGDLNQALTQAAAHAARRGAEATLVLPSDLPLIGPEDLRALIRLSGGRPRMVIACDRAGIGTNALYTAPAATCPYRFGVRSFRRHLFEARRLGIPAQILRRPALAFDIDTPRDFADLRALEQARGKERFTAGLD
ncbi:MAG: 2-phospho-L-lactate guanylyltransferase [Alphaproteobacteria bacterium]|jgi:2-phospho-L-lactate guanylyltransferase|nr:2-phospho-L-lactate guanylyltransferase [Alphaproteobacteria bacterium]MDP6517715.1 2-phospho-L-lactate guanylyltransferase [Alphaproteobacteria bacterium]